MSLTKVPYVSNQTVITAQNLNDIQDAILALENNKVTTTNSVQLAKLPGGKIRIDCNNLIPGKEYSIRVWTRSRHGRNKTGPWRQLDRWGWSELKSKSGTLYDNYSMPDWMGVSAGYLNTDFHFTPTETTYSHIINVKEWMIPNLKPQIGTVEEGNIVINPGLGWDNPHLIGLSSSSGRTQLQFKFKLYDSDTDELIADCNETAYISGFASSEASSSGQVFIGQNENGAYEITNIFIKIK